MKIFYNHFTYCNCVSPLVLFLCVSARWVLYCLVEHGGVEWEGCYASGIPCLMVVDFGVLLFTCTFFCSRPSMCVSHPSTITLSSSAVYSMGTAPYTFPNVASLEPKVVQYNAQFLSLFFLFLIPSLLLVQIGSPSDVSLCNNSDVFLCWAENYLLKYNCPICYLKGKALKVLPYCHSANITKKEILKSVKKKHLV